MAWVSVDDRDNDPAVLFTYLAVALDGVERVEPKVFRSIAARAVGVADVVRLVSAIGRMSEPVIVVLDNAELLTNAECHDMIAELSLRLPPGSQLAIGSRRPVPVPVARLRSQRGIVEVGRDELAMDVTQARHCSTVPVCTSPMSMSSASWCELRAGRRGSTWRHWR